ncbi:MAG: hypothetical protein IJV37_02325 [Bacteroidales bacterium]|nr:hypothetical protein [Bacteroidales bacterium]
MKRFLMIVVISSLYFSLSYAQEHIIFNGATFGQTQKEFQSNLNGHPTSSYLISHSNKNLYHRYFLKDVPLSTYRCKMFLHCSIKTKTVFETITWIRVTKLKDELKYFVMVFEEKYGGHLEEPQNELGYIKDGHLSSYASTGQAISDDGYYVYSDDWDSYKEMLALKYIIHRKTDNKAIGEIRISAAPDHKITKDTDSYGYIEITYRDYAAAEKSIKEYNNTMSDIL